MSAAGSLAKLGKNIRIGFLSAADQDLVGRLSQMRGGRYGQLTRTHVDIVSHTLCDDVIDRLGPSLQRHIGCDLIDVNPGVGLFSQKLHDYLKPRTHLLVEPESVHNDSYTSFLTPLVERPSSTYRLLRLPSTARTTYQSLAQDGHLPHQKVLGEGDPALNRPNDSLLLVANLTFITGKQEGNFVSAAGQILHRLLTDIRDKANLQSYGLVRMLVWMADHEKATYLPRTVTNRRKTSVEAEALTETISEVISGDTSVGFLRREKHADLLSARRMYAKMTAAGVVVPEPRRTNLLKEIMADVPADTDPTAAAAQTRDWHAELATLQGQLERGEFTRYHGDKPKLGSAKRSSGFVTTEYARMRKLESALGAQQKYEREVESLMQQSTKVDTLEESLASMNGGLDDPQRAQTEAKLAMEKQKYVEALGRAKKQVRAMLGSNLDDRRALAVDPPLLLWDRRTVEPLLAHPFEFFPNQEPPALLDFQPKTLSPVLMRNADSYRIFTYLASSLFVHPAKPVATVLDTLGWGAADALVPKVPALTDPARGGRRDVSELTVRMLTMEMLEGLVEAWEGWLFKPSVVDTMLRAGEGTTASERRKKHRKVSDDL